MVIVIMAINLYRALQRTLTNWSLSRKEIEQSCEGPGNHSLWGTIETAEDVYIGKDTFKNMIVLRKHWKELSHESEIRFLQCCSKDTIRAKEYKLNLDLFMV